MRATTSLFALALPSPDTHMSAPPRNPPCCDHTPTSRPAPGPAPGPTFAPQAGAGIVADSVPEKEFEETVNKAAALGRAIDLAEAAFVQRP